jgi:hypothetical protein
MALSATHYPGSGLTLGILYGSTFAIEKTVLQRLQSISFEAAHPTLLLGICAELELSRHTQLIENSVNDIETKIFDLNFQSGNVNRFSRIELEKRNIDKRTAWLDLTYLCNSITTWNTQLLKVAEHTEALNKELYTTPEIATSSTPDVNYADNHTKTQSRLDNIPPRMERHPRLLEGKEKHHYDLRYSSVNQMKRLRTLDMTWPHDECINLPPYCKEYDIRREEMQRVSKKIAGRITAIRDEYDEKIRDCTMCVDGMAMATQWVKHTPLIHLSLLTCAVA